MSSIDPVAAVLARIKPLSKASLPRLLALAGALRRLDAEDIAGDLVECGVFQGANIILMRTLSPQRICWLFDTFAGMTRPGEHDGDYATQKYAVRETVGKPWQAAPLEQVGDNLRAAGVYDETKLRFVVGDVCVTLRNPATLPQRIALLLLDTDFYQSTRVELETLFPRLVAGGVLLIDDFGHWPGARKAVDDYLAAAGIDRGELAMVDYTGAILVKNRWASATK